MNKYDEMLDLYIGELIPQPEILNLIKSRIDMQINKLSANENHNKYYAGSILDSPVYNRTSDIFKKAFSVLEKYNFIFCEGNRFPIFATDEVI